MKVPTVDTELRQIPGMGHQMRALVTAMERPQTPVMGHQRKAPTLTALQHLVAMGPRMKAQMMATGHPPKVLTLTVHLRLVAMVLPMRVRMMGMVRLQMMAMEHQARAPMTDTEHRQIRDMEHLQKVLTQGMALLLRVVMEHQRILAMGHQVKVLTTVMEHHQRVLTMAMEHPLTLATGPPRRAQTTATVHHQILAMGHQRKVPTQAMARHHKAMVLQHRVLTLGTGLLHEEMAEERIREAGGRADGKATREGEKVEAHLQVMQVQHHHQPTVPQLTLGMEPPQATRILAMEPQHRALTHHMVLHH